MEFMKGLDWSPLLISLKTGVVATILSFWRNLCGKTGGKSRSEDKSGAGRDSDPSDGTATDGSWIFSAADLQSAAAVWCGIVWQFWNQSRADLAGMYPGGDRDRFSANVPEREGGI